MPRLHQFAIGWPLDQSQDRFDWICGYINASMQLNVPYKYASSTATPFQHTWARTASPSVTCSSIPLPPVHCSGAACPVTNRLVAPWCSATCSSKLPWARTSLLRWGQPLLGVIPGVGISPRQLTSWFYSMFWSDTIYTFNAQDFCHQITTSYRQLIFWN